MIAPVETTTSTMLFSIRSTITCRMPAAMSEPARPRKIVGRCRSRSIASKTAAHLPSARAWNDAFRYESRSSETVVFAVTLTGVVGLPRSAFLRLRSTPTAASCVYSRALGPRLSFSIPSARTSGKNPVRGHRGPVAGVDVDRRHAVRAGVDGGKKRGEPAERRAVAAGRRNGDQRPSDEPADDGEERRLHARRRR